MAFHPYLMFTGDCREAFTRYQEIFGGELTLLRAGDMPPGAASGEVPADMIMHAALVGGDELLMGSDDPTSDSHQVEGIFVNYSAKDVADAERVFAALADGGKVTLPLEEAFFSPRFGMCVDRFGTPWMITAPAEGS